MIKRLLCIFLIIIFSFSACTYEITEEEASVRREEGILTVHFIDVGQGDCILLQNEKTTMLIDSGTSDSGVLICEYLNSLSIEKLDYFIGTHPHEDHLGGAAAVISQIDIDNLYLTEAKSTAFFFERLLDAVINKNITVNIPKTGCRYKAEGFDFEFLSPETDFGNENDNSIVMRVDFGETSFLFMGDAEKNTEKYLLSNNKRIDADVIKIGHHGSRNASLTEFLNAVKPRAAVIQCGKGNSYGHPHDEALARIKKSGAEIFRCDELGTVVLKSDGTNITDENGNVLKENTVEVKMVYIGNKKSLKYHLDECRNLPNEKNSVVFFSEEQAIMSGFSPCGSCKP